MLKFFESKRTGVLRATRFINSYSTVQRKPGIRRFLMVDIGSSVNIVACTTCTAGQKIFFKIRLVTAYIDGLSVTTPSGPSRPGSCQPTLRFHCRYSCMYVDGIRTIELHNCFTVIWFPCVVWIDEAIDGVFVEHTGHGNLCCVTDLAFGR